MDAATDPVSSLWEALALDVDRYLARRVEPDAVEDLRQDVLAKVHANRDALRSEDAVTAWVFRITRNVVVDHLRKRRDTAPLGEDLAAAEADEADEFSAAAAQVLGTWLRTSVDSLPPLYGEALRLVELEGLSQKEAADKLGISYTAMKSRVQRGRALLREALLRCCEIERDVRGRVIDFRSRGCEPGNGCC